MVETYMITRIPLAILVLSLFGCGADRLGEQHVETPDVQPAIVVDSSALTFQAELNKQYLDSAHSPLLPEDLVAFQQLEFFDIEPRFNVVADFKRVVSEPFEMPTTTDRRPIYEKYGEVYFTLEGKEFMLNLFQSHNSREDSVWMNYLFLPFNDLTNGHDTYGGGRFIDVLMPENGMVSIDFNKSYNPYCAYNHKYSCPIPPEENFLEVRVTAGVKAWVEH